MGFIKKWLTRFLVTFALLSLIPTFLFFYGLTQIKEKRVMVKDSVVLTMNLSTAIYEEASKPGFNFFKTPGLSLLEVMASLKKATTDKRVKGIILNGRSINLGLAQLQELRAMILEFQKEGKFAVFYTDTFGEMTSSVKNYYFATACKEIWMQPTGELNLTGIQLEIPFFAKILKEWGVNAQIGTREEYKNAMTFLTDESLSPANEESFKSLAKGIYGQMTAGITKDREIPLETLTQITQSNPMLSGADALKLDLVDKLVYQDDIEDLIKKRVKGDMDFVKLRHYAELLRHENSKLMDDFTKTDANKTRVALIYATGEIVRNSTSDNPLNPSQSNQLEPDEIRKAVDEILKDQTIKAVILRVDSPGGSAVASDSIWYSFKRLRDKKIPIIVTMGNAAASGGYWIAMAGDHIIADPLTITGSIGVIGGKVSFENLLQKLNVNMGVVSEGPNSEIWSMINGYTPAQWDIIQRTIDRVYQNFLKKVGEGRKKLTPEHIHEVAKGRAWLGFEAKEFGLIDELGGLTNAISAAKRLLNVPQDKAIPIDVFPRPKGLKEYLSMILDGDDEDKDSLFDDLLLTVGTLRNLIKNNGIEPGAKAIIPTVK